MLWWVVFFGFWAGIAYCLAGFAKQVDEVEDDARYVYENRPREPYGSNFVRILFGREG